MIPATGRVRFAGEDILQAAPHALVGKGLALVPEGRGIFARMSVLENLLMGAYSRSGSRAGRPAIDADIDHVFGLLPRLKERAEQIAGTLSGGEQQMLAIGRALMSRPRLLLLDEPSMGLAPLMVSKVFDVIGQIAASGVTVLLVEQNARRALSLCARGYVLESGAITLSDRASVLLQDENVQRAYLGG
jgi:branched-chain amino acid transport system ATP-binding protein